MYQSNVLHRHKLAMFDAKQICSCAKNSVLVKTVRFCNWYRETLCSGEVNPLQTYFKDVIT
jgi:hypothetical protein